MKHNPGMIINVHHEYGFPYDTSVLLSFTVGLNQYG